MANTGVRWLAVATIAGMTTACDTPTERRGATQPTEVMEDVTAEMAEPSEAAPGGATDPLSDDMAEAAAETEADAGVDPDASDPVSRPVPSPALAPASPEAPPADLPQNGAWLTGGDRGTLTADGLSKILDACDAQGITARACAARVANGAPPFALLDRAVAEEAALLLRSCRVARDRPPCRVQIEDERYVRDQDIGRAEPNTLSMQQDEPIVWSVAIRKSDLRVTPGSTTITESTDPADPDAGRTVVENTVSYTENTCFLLEYDASAFAVAKDRVCPDYQRGATPYVAKWRVTPLKSGQQQLWVRAVHERDGRQIAAEIVPTSPFTIDVEHWLIAWIAELDLWIKVALSIGALLGAIRSWSIWRAWKRRNRQSEQAG